MIRAHLLHTINLAGEAFDLPRARLCVSGFILEHFLGDAWVREHLFGGATVPSFLRPQHDTCPRAAPELNVYRYNERVWWLAETLLNLHPVEGFNRRLLKMQTDDVQTCMAELGAAALLGTSGIPFRFVDETGQTGSDYDIEVVTGGLPVACESKCKLEDTVLSKETVRDALNKARSQLPDDRPGVVFLRIPELWARNPDAKAEFDAGLHLSLKRTGRISAVIVHWEVWEELFPQGAACFRMFRTEHNPKARVSLAAGDQLIQPDKLMFWRNLDVILFGHTANETVSISFLSETQASHSVQPVHHLLTPIVSRDGVYGRGQWISSAQRLESEVV